MVYHLLLKYHHEIKYYKNCFVPSTGRTNEVSAFQDPQRHEHDLIKKIGLYEK